jgi:hypothetical protein
MIGLLMLAAASAPMDVATQSDFLCAQLTAREIRITPEGDDRASYGNAHAYYLGRLSARDHTVRWTVKWEDRINEAVKLHPLPASQYAARLFKCMDYYIDEMPDLAPE